MEDQTEAVTTNEVQPEPVVEELKVEETPEPVVEQQVVHVEQVVEEVHKPEPKPKHVVEEVK